MTKLFITLFVLMIFITSCIRDKGNKRDVFTNIYSSDNLTTQTFSINASIDNIITGANGTKIRIPKNSFVDSTGLPVSGMIEIRLKEALTKKEMVVGNLTTTFNGKPLETGGMIFIDAISKDKSLLIGENKSIQVALPTDSALNGMSLFSGKQDSSGIKWENPIPLIKPGGDSAGISIDLFEKTTNIMYSVDGFESIKDQPDTVVREVGRIAWEGDGLKITKDSVFKIGNYTVNFYKQDRLQKWNEVFTTEKGTNGFNEDKNAHYIFSLKKLGWANIDRLLADPRTIEVELITSIENQSDFKFVYVTLVTQKMYLPGYQKKDNTFCFSHNDDEPQQLPVGETATIIATAYKNDKPYFAIQQITITDKQTITFKLIETTVEKLKAELQEKI
jgi:hypothetical protein